MAQTSIQSLEKIAKTSEDTKKLLGKLTKLNSQIGKKDETQATKLSSLVKKVADSSFTPTFLQKFLQKPDEEGNDLATRLEKTQNDFIGSFVTLFKNREAKEAARLNIEVSKLRELQANPALTKEDIEKIVAKEKSEELAKQLEEVKEANTKSFENLVEMFKLDTSALETFSEKDQALLKENINLHGDVKKVLEDTQVPHHKQVQALEKIVSASHEKGSLFVHDINTQEQLDKLNNYNEIEIEMAKDKMRRDNISALQDKENQKQLLNATKAGGMGAAGMGAAGESGSNIGLAEAYLGVKGTTAAITGIKAALATGAGVALKTALIAAGPILGVAALAAFTLSQMKKTREFVKNLSQEEKNKRINAFLGKGFETAGMSEAEKIEFSKNFQEKHKEGLKSITEHDVEEQKEFFKSMTEPKLDAQTNVLLEQIKKGKEGAPVSNPIVNTIQDNSVTKSETNPIFEPQVIDGSRLQFMK